MKYSTSTAGLVMTAVSALCFSTLPIFGLYAYAAGANVTTLLGVRFLIASGLLWAVLLVTRKDLPKGRVGLWLIFMGAVGYSTQSVLYLSAVEADRLSPALAALLLYTYPALVTILAWLFDGQRITGRQALALGLTMVGTALVLLSSGEGVRFTLVGAALALGAALVYASYILFGSRVLRQTSPLAATAYVSSAAAAVFLGFGAATGRLVPVALPGWFAMSGMAVVATVFAVLLFFGGIERVGPARASIISTLEPVGTVALSVLLLGDRLGLLQLAGGGLVLAGVAWLQIGADG